MVSGPQETIRMIPGFSLIMRSYSAQHNEYKNQERTHKSTYFPFQR